MSQSNVIIETLKMSSYKDDNYLKLKKVLVPILNGLNDKLKSVRKMLKEKPAIHICGYNIATDEYSTNSTVYEVNRSNTDLNKLREIYISRVRYINYLLGIYNICDIYKLNTENSYTDMYSKNDIIDRVVDIHDSTFYSWAKDVKKSIAKEIPNLPKGLNILLVDYVNYENYL